MEEEEVQHHKSRKSILISNERLIDVSANSIVEDRVSENKEWQEIRKGIIEELGENIYKAWFSKAEATTCAETNTLILTMPTRFMADWVKNNYSHVIRRLSEGCGVKRVEYC